MCKPQTTCTTNIKNHFILGCLTITNKWEITSLHFYHWNRTACCSSLRKMTYSVLLFVPSVWDGLIGITILLYIFLSWTLLVDIGFCSIYLYYLSYCQKNICIFSFFYYERFGPFGKYGNSLRAFKRDLSTKILHQKWTCLVLISLPTTEFNFYKPNVRIQIMLLISCKACWIKRHHLSFQDRWFPSAFCKSARLNIPEKSQCSGDPRFVQNNFTLCWSSCLSSRLICKQKAQCNCGNNRNTKLTETQQIWV